ncbi:Protein RecA [Wickerhamiella sorbophila]|uniref:Protein RecA n=1 Tax=Wickerhamiella sorbophila TaxID=45607 RepID=A0A2T0FPE5_9ASCO|nr:Protein RecA [Wickerhamiella sorbophila]PRT56860.1 Protein RecA [Wickerhamiella sorbophila]
MAILSELLYRRKQKGLSTGNPVLNVAISGSRDGLPIPSLNEISGPPACGKTTILLHLLIDALKAGRRCLWINAGYRTIPIQRLRNTLGYEERFEKYLEFISVSDLAEVSLLPTVVGDQYEVILMPSYYDIFPPLSPGALRKRAIDDTGSKVYLQSRKAARTLLHGVFCQLSEKACLILTSNMVTINDPTNRQLRILQPPLQLKKANLLVVYRDHRGEIATGNGYLLDPSSGALCSTPKTNNRIHLEYLTSSFNDSQGLHSSMLEPTPPKAPRPRPDLNLNSDPPDGNFDAATGTVFDTQPE